MFKKSLVVLGFSVACMQNGFVQGTTNAPTSTDPHIQQLMQKVEDAGKMLGKNWLSDRKVMNEIESLRKNLKEKCEDSVPAEETSPACLGFEAERIKLMMGKIEGNKEDIFLSLKYVDAKIELIKAIQDKRKKIVENEE